MPITRSGPPPDGVVRQALFDCGSGSVGSERSAVQQRLPATRRIIRHLQTEYALLFANASHTGPDRSIRLV